MAKYKQKVIPSINTPVGFKKLSAHDLRKFVTENYNARIRGKTVRNQCLGFTIHFSGSGLRKLTRGSSLYPNKAIAVLVIDKLLEVAEFNNFGQPKPSDPKELAGYLNFKAKCRIDGEIQTLRIATMVFRKDGKIYWNHDTSIKKG